MMKIGQIMVLISIINPEISYFFLTDPYILMIKMVIEKEQFDHLDELHRIVVEQKSGKENGG